MAAGRKESSASAESCWRSRQNTENMISKNIRVNNEFYVAPAYNQMIAKKMKLGVYNIGKVLDGMYGLGTPEDLEIFMKLEVSKKATSF